MPAPRTLLLDDYQILDQLASGKSIAQLAREHHVSAQAVRWRLQALRENLPAPAARRADQTLTHTLNAIEELARNHEILDQLRDACLRQLEGPGGTLDVGPHAGDIEVVVSIAGGPPQRKRLAQLLEKQEDTTLLALESKHADPRDVLLKVLSQIRAQIELAVRLTERIHDAQQLAIFQETMIRHIEKAAPEVGAAIKSELHHQRQLRLALAPTPTTGQRAE